jgi:hypothetical protein
MGTGTVSSILPVSHWIPWANLRNWGGTSSVRRNVMEMYSIDKIRRGIFKAQKC